MAGALGLAVGLAACGSARTELPTSLPPAPPLQAAPAKPTTLATLTANPAPAPDTGPDASPDTTASSFKSPGEKHALAGGTLAASYPRVGVRPPRGVAPAPAGQSWTVVNVRFCAGPQDPIDGGLVDPVRFRIEVPGQGQVSPAPDAPALAPAPLAAGTVVAPGTCVEGSIAFLIGGEGHVESATYDTGGGLLRWAT